MLNENEYVEVEGRDYISPQLAIDESNAFIDNLRQTQNAQNAQIVADTQALGTNVPSNLGGLTGGESYFTSRYQTPQTNSVVANLRATAQAAALNDVLANEQAIWKKRYQDAYKAAQRRANARARAGGGGGGGTPSTTTVEGGGDVKTEDTSMTIQGAVPGVPGGYTVARLTDPDAGDYSGYIGVPYGEEYETNYTYIGRDKTPRISSSGFSGR